MTNLDSILKIRDITLTTKVPLVKAMVFPVVMYGCECWTKEKAEHRRIDAFEPQGDQTSQLEINHSLEGLWLKLQCFDRLMQRAD